MKINFILPPINMTGGMRVIAIHAAALKRFGHQVTLIAPPEYSNSFWTRYLRLKQAVSAKSHFSDLGLEVHILNKRRSVAEDDVPDGDVVVATWWETAEWVIRLPICKGAKVYFIQHHEIFDWLPVERCKATYRLPMAKIVVANWLSDVLREEYGATDVELVPNSVNHSQFYAPVRSKQIRPTVGFLYSAAPFKGMDITLKAIAQLRKAHPSLRVVAFGSDYSPHVLEGEIEMSIDPPQECLKDIYAKCDVWLTASRSEGFNLPAMEAMACRTPVVSTNVGWPAESIVDGRNGWLVDIDDWYKMYKVTDQILRMRDSDWVAMSAAAFSTVADSSWEKSSRLFEGALYNARKQFS